MKCTGKTSRFGVGQGGERKGLYCALCISAGWPHSHRVSWALTAASEGISDPHWGQENQDSEAKYFDQSCSYCVFPQGVKPKSEASWAQVYSFLPSAALPVQEGGHSCPWAKLYSVLLSPDVFLLLVISNSPSFPGKGSVYFDSPGFEIADLRRVHWRAANGFGHLALTDCNYNHLAGVSICVFPLRL